MWPFDPAIILLRLYSIKVKDLEHIEGCLVKHYLERPESGNKVNAYNRGVTE